MDADDKVAQFISLKPTTFHRVVLLEVRQGSMEDEYETHLKMELRPSDPQDKRRLILSCEGVRTMNLVTPDDSLFYFVSLQIRSIREDQWEGLNYKVYEDEQDSEFMFYCYDFTAKVVPVHPIMS